MVKLIAKNIQNHFNNFKLKYSLKKEKKSKQIDECLLRKALH